MQVLAWREQGGVRERGVGEVRSVRRGGDRREEDKEEEGVATSICVTIDAVLSV